MTNRAYRVGGTIKFYEPDPYVLNGRRDIKDMLETVEVYLNGCIIAEAKVIELIAEDIGVPPKDHLERDYEDWIREFEGKEPIKTITFKKA